MSLTNQDMMSHSLFGPTRNAGLYFAAAILAACGVSDRKVNEGSGGNSSSAGSGASSGAGTSAGGSSAQGGATTDGGAGAPGSSGTAGEAGALGTDAGTGCVNDSVRCADNSTPSLCVDGTWVDQAACPAATPACSNGVCAAATLSGGIVTVSNGVLSTSTVHLVEHGLEYTQTVCGTVAGQQVCVSGGIRP
jgi:hypothetical protein